jgi:hypothetical protein
MNKHRFPLVFRARVLGSVSIACALGVSLPACVDAEPRDLGFTQSSDDLSVDDRREPFVSPSSEFVGRWLGSAEEPLALSEDGSTTQYAFPSGSTRIELVLEPNDENTLQGRIVFGEGQPPPPPVDAEAGYPVGAAYQSLLGYSYTDSDGYDIDLDFGDLTLPPFEGVEYKVALGGIIIFDAEDNSGVPDGVAPLFFNTADPLAPWCELQTPQPSPRGGFSCAPDFGADYELFSDGSGASCEVSGDPSSCDALLPDFSTCGDDCDYSAYYACTDNVPGTQVNCDKLYMCRANLCECTESSCTSKSFTGEALRVRRIGDELIGLFYNTLFENERGLNVPLGEVRLRLQP